MNMKFSYSLGGVMPYTDILAGLSKPYTSNNNKVLTFKYVQEDNIIVYLLKGI